ncbi:UNVERIFIED_CONTAM: Lipid phosphate phosphatase delta [Sesamum angustifolium]|uniref:Lipid phosphate phosphatase delta n=1 Tax=Sesamum angustifolium TaxID=2727405 RepID=A0AAW2MTG1_9LAMI
MESITGWQPWVSRLVISGTPIILKIQKYQHRHLDALFSGLSCVVSVPFYTAFLPLLFWTGHCKLARQMTLLMAFCDYVGNCIKSNSHQDEEENAMEYGLPSSHTLNTVCLSGYLLHYILDYNESNGVFIEVAGFAMVCLFVGLIGLVVSFWAALSFLLLFAYPTPELPTPSFEYHTAFNGVALGIVIGIHQTFHQFHHENVPRVFSPQLTFLAFVGRILLGIPTILLVKFCSKALAKWIIPIVANTLGIPSYLRKVFFFSKQTSFDVDTGIRLLQYAGLAWSVVDLVPSVFSHLGL